MGGRRVEDWGEERRTWALVEDLEEAGEVVGPEGDSDGVGGGCAGGAADGR